MKLVGIVLAAAAVGQVAAFGGSEWTAQQTCHDCVCAYDVGTEDDPKDKACCNVNTWNSFCDGVAQDRALGCSVKCLGHVAHEGEGKEGGLAKNGEFCGELSYSKEECEKGLICHLGDGVDKVGHCDFLHSILDEAIEAGPDDFEYAQFKAMGIDLVSVAPHNHTDGELGDVHFDVNIIEGFDKEKVLSDLATFLNLSPEDLALNEKPTRRQYYSNRYNPYTVSVRGQQSSYPSASPGGSQAQMESTKKTFEQTGIRHLAFDWDKTANTEHTFKGTYSSYEQLKNLMSPDFVSLAGAWCNDGKPVSIVTYNDEFLYVGGRSVKGPEMIREVLKLTFPTNPKCANMPIYAANLSGTGKGKQPHLQQAQAAAGTNSKNTVLIDDTKQNIDIAQRYGQPNVWVNPAKGYYFSNMVYYKY